MPAPPSFSVAADVGLDYSGKGKCFFRTDANPEEVRVGDL